MSTGTVGSSVNNQGTKEFLCINELIMFEKHKGVYIWNPEMEKDRSIKRERSDQLQS